MIEFRLSDALHASAATIDPVPDLAAFGVALTEADRTHRRRAVAAVATVAAAACVAGVAVARARDASRSVDVAPAQRTGDGTYDGPHEIKVPDPTVVPPDVLVAAPESPVDARPTFAVPGTAVPASAPPDIPPPPPPPAGMFTASASYGSCGGAAPYDYYTGEAPSGQTVSATSAYGGGSVVAGADGHWAMKVFFYDVVGKPAPKTFPVTISTAGHPSVVLSFTYTGP